MRDGYTVLSAYLRTEEAEMLRGLLESAGIECIVDDAALASINPLLQSAIGGAKVLVRETDAGQARAVAAANGLLPGEAGGNLGDDLQAVAGSSAPDDPEERPDVREPELASRRALRAAFVALLLAPTVVVPLFVLGAVWRFLREHRSGRTAGAPPASRAARARLVAATVLALLSLAVGYLFWTEIAPLVEPDVDVGTVEFPGR